MKLSVIVPVFNERENIPLVHQAIDRALRSTGVSYEMIFVNDGSRDGSEEELDKVARLDQAVKVVHFRRNFGQTAAMSAGIEMACGELIAFLDGDLQNDPDDITMMIEKIEEG